MTLHGILQAIKKKGIDKVLKKLVESDSVTVKKKQEISKRINDNCA